MDREEMRKAFEEWAGREGYDCESIGFGDDKEFVINETWALWLCWQAAMAHSCELVRNELHRDIMNLPCKYEAAWGSPSPSDWVEGYVNGHRDTRYAAAELALSTLSRHGG